MSEPKTKSEKIEYLSSKGWLIPSDADETDLENLKMTLPILTKPETWYSIDEAYLAQKFVENNSDKN